MASPVCDRIFNMEKAAISLATSVSLIRDSAAVVFSAIFATLLAACSRRFWYAPNLLLISLTFFQRCIQHCNRFIRLPSVLHSVSAVPYDSPTASVWEYKYSPCRWRCIGSADRPPGFLPFAAALSAAAYWLLLSWPYCHWHLP